MTEVQTRAAQTAAALANLKPMWRAVEMRCLCRVLGISYTEHITIEAVRATITKHTERYEELLTTAKKTTMVWSCDKTRWPIKDRLPRYSSRWKKKGQAEKEMDGQHCRVDRKELCHDPNPCP